MPISNQKYHVILIFTLLVMIISGCYNSENMISKTSTGQIEFHTDYVSTGSFSEQKKNKTDFSVEKKKDTVDLSSVFLSDNANTKKINTIYDRYMFKIYE